MARRIALATLAAFLAGTSPSEAALTAEKCLAQKRNAWTAFRQCEGKEDEKRLVRKPTDVAKNFSNFGLHARAVRRSF
jgi:hypothetical protein